MYDLAVVPVGDTDALHDMFKSSKALDGGVGEPRVKGSLRVAACLNRPGEADPVQHEESNRPLQLRKSIHIHSGELFEELPAVNPGLLDLTPPCAVAR